MSDGNDRVTNRQLYEELTKLRDGLPSRRELYAVVAVGNVFAAALLKFTPAGPAVATAAEHALNWL